MATHAPHRGFPSQSTEHTLDSTLSWSTEAHPSSQIHASPPSSPISPNSSSSAKFPRKFVFSRPNVLRSPLKIRIPLPKLVASTSTVHFEHVSGSLLARDSDSHDECTLDHLSAASPRIVSPASVDSRTNSSGPGFGLESLSLSSPSSSESSSSSSSTTSESDQLSLSSAPTSGLNSPIAFDDAEAFGSPRAAVGFFCVSSPSGSSAKSSQATPAAKQLTNTRQTQTHASPSHVGPFQFIRALNSGSYGAAYTVRDLSSGRTLCAKVCEKQRVQAYRPELRGSSSISSEDEANEDDRRRRGERRANEYLRGMLAEMRAYQRIAAAGEKDRVWLMDAHGVLQDEGRVLFVMDLMQADLFTVIASSIPRGMIKRWVAQIAIGIHALHGMGIIHRDIKPENIFIVPGTSNAYVRIGDFTNAWLSSARTHTRTVDLDRQQTFKNEREKGEQFKEVRWYRTYTRKYIGTKEYLAPEVYRREWYGPMVDWWALGCLVWDLLVGDALFPDEQTINFYIKWQREQKSAQSYLTYRANSLTEDEAGLLAGLLALDPLSRSRLQQVERHPFFLESCTSEDAPSTTVNVFDEMRTVPISTLRKRLHRRDDREWTIDDSLRDEPLCHASARPRKQDSTEDEEERKELDELRWVNPRGILGMC